MAVYKSSLSCGFVIFLGYLLSVAYGQTISVPIRIRTVEVIPDPNFTNISVTFTSPKKTDVKWTVNDGFIPTDLNPSTLIAFTRHRVNSTNVASISFPKEMPFNSLRIHIVCPHTAFQAHAEFGVSHLTPATSEVINQFTVFVPRGSEIGITSRGKSRFHIYVNTTRTLFVFGHVAAEAHFVATNSPEVNTLTAYSFMPIMWTNGLRIKPMFNTGTEYHADIFLENPALHVSGGIISISAACTSTGSLIQRIDFKQSLYLHSRPKTGPVPPGSLAFVKEMSPKVIPIAKSDSFVLRCTAFANPAPTIELYKKSGNQIAKVNIPSYVTSLPYETTAAFQFVNVTKTEEGKYGCKASNGVKEIETVHTLKVVN